ncbi:0c7b4131-407c-4a25-b42f-81070b3dd5f2 [Thermothielavioides terrestris]
MLLAR